MAATAFALGGGGELAAHSGAVWNGTESLPFGLYWKVPGRPTPVVAGDYVVICAPGQAANVGLSRGYIPRDTTGRGCAGGTNPVLKRVYATVGDRYAVNAYGVTVNGYVVRNSAPLRHDDRGRPLWDGRAHEAILGPPPDPDSERL